MYAVRNIRLCTKDCLCLYVCPTGATDTETGQIDPEKCLDGCRLCVDACPSHAIYLIPETYPPQQEKSTDIQSILSVLSKSKTTQENIARTIVNSSTDLNMKQFAKAVSMSNRIMAEDILREAGFMLPQSQNAQDLLSSLLESEQPEDFPKEVALKLLSLLQKSNKPIEDTKT